jgi:uncharacterized membrane protein YhhN
MIRVFFYIMTTGSAVRIRHIKEDKDMLGAIILIILFFSVLKIGLKLAWSVMKFVFGLGLFFFCQLLFVLAAATGMFGSMLIPLIVLIVLFTFGFIRV